MASTIFFFGFPIYSPSKRTLALKIRASSCAEVSSPAWKSLKSAAATAVILTAGASALLSGRSSLARAETVVPQVAELLSQDADPEALSSLRSLLYSKLEGGEDSDAMAILRRLMEEEPEDVEWKFLASRLAGEMGDAAESRRLLEEILAVDPLCFEALFQNAVLMDQCNEGVAVIERLERALELARSEQNEKAARDVRLIMAQIQYLQKNIDAALSSYEELEQEDPNDYRPYFCQGVIFSLLDRHKEAKEKFSKYHKLSPKKFNLDCYLQTTPLSRVKLFGDGTD